MYKYDVIHKPEVGYMTYRNAVIQGPLVLRYSRGQIDIQTGCSKCKI